MELFHITSVTAIQETSYMPWTVWLVLKGQKLETSRLSIQLSLTPSLAERGLRAKFPHLKGVFACIKTRIQVTPLGVSEEERGRPRAQRLQPFSAPGKLQKLICALGPRQLCRGMPKDGLYHSLVACEFLPGEKCRSVFPVLH